MVFVGQFKERHVGIVSDIKGRCVELPNPGGGRHRELTALINESVTAGTIEAGRFIQDSDGYWGEAKAIQLCQCGLTRDPDGVSWVSLKGKPGLTTFRSLVPVRMKVRAHPRRTRLEGEHEIRYGGVSWFESTKLWCQAMAVTGSFRCAQTGNRYCWLNDQFSSTVIEGVEVCYETATFHYWESDEQYHFEPEPARANRQQAVQQQRLPQWHSIQNHAARQVKATKDLVYGCELEIYSNQDRMITWKTATDLGMIGEHDGSLDTHHGIEIVGVPGTLKWHADPEGPWMKFLVNMNTRDFKKGDELIARACGFNAPDGPDTHGRPATYGMHVSINRLAITKDHQARMVQFVNECAKLCEKVAGRPTNETAAYRLKDITQIMNEIETHQSIKYEALAVRSETRLELRIFKSTLDRKGFLKNVEFCDAMVGFTKTDLCKKLLEDETPSERLLTSEFKKWLSTREELYPNLHDRLFAVKKGKVAL